ncbi:MAG: hypothetical protein ACKORY_05890, partial [Actinomycetota bacterium]
MSGLDSTWPMPDDSPHSLYCANTAGSTHRDTGRWCVVGRRYWPIVTMSTPTAARSRSVARTSSSVSP